MDKETIKDVFSRAVAEARPYTRLGKVADYIPELARADGSQLGICVVDNGGQVFAAGDYRTKFTMQSIGKVFALLMALETFGHDTVFERVGMEPSGAPFSELTTLGEFSEKPSNPFINAGAIVITSLLSNRMSFDDFLNSMRLICDNPSLRVNERVYASELDHSDRNHSIAWELKRLDLLEDSIDHSLDFYTRLCSVEIDTIDLARLGLVLANHGTGPGSGTRYVTPEHVTTTLSLMFTCGLYDGSGAFAVHSGLPAKSGVGGGIIAVIPDKYGIGTFGPALDSNGNSIGGVHLLDRLSSELNWHQFGPTF